MDNELDKNSKEHEEWVREICRDEISLKPTTTKKWTNEYPIITLLIALGIFAIMLAISIISFAQGLYAQCLIAAVLSGVAAFFFGLEIANG